MNCGMPRACISCECYDHLGYAHDDQTPFVEWYGTPKNNSRVAFGKCKLLGVKVFATEICNTYKSLPDITHLHVKTVKNQNSHVKKGCSRCFNNLSGHVMMIANL